MSLNLEIINVGTSPNSNDGEVLRNAFIIVNNNFQTIEDYINYNDDQLSLIRLELEDVDIRITEIENNISDINDIRDNVNSINSQLLTINQTLTDISESMITEAPDDGKLYVRKSKDWQSISLNMANNTELGLVKANQKSAQTKEVVIDTNGFLFTESEIFRTSVITQSQSISSVLNGRHFLVQGNVTLTTVKNTTFVDFKNTTFTITAGSTLTFVANDATIITGDTTFSEGQTVQLLSVDTSISNYRTVTLANENPRYKTISTNTVLNNNYNNAIVRVNSSVTITIPTGLNSNFNCVFDAVGDIEVTFIASSGVTLNAPWGNKLKSNNLASLTPFGTSNSYRLVGGLEL